MYNGVLLLCKPQGFTSHDAIAKLRGIFGQRRIGHAGTLDPMAEGLLIVLLGSATRASDWAAGQDKEYIARLRLGTVTDTQDITGNILETRPVCVTEEELRKMLCGFTGPLLQMPPMYSAVQVGGQRLYKLARRGVEIERERREIVISSLEMLPRERGTPETDFDLRIVCSKGTYVRTLCHDLGAALGCGGCMAALTRTRCGGFTIGQAHTLEELECIKPNLSPFVLPTDTAFSGLPIVTANAAGIVRARNGAFLAQEHLAAGTLPPVGGLCRVYADNAFVWLGECRILDIGGDAVFCRASFFADR
jgi:tRNA pseudouridine 55 synthase